MSAPEPIVFGFVIEGKGEEDATRVLIRRICNEVLQRFAVKMTRPVRVTKSKLIRPENYRR